jgi:hypothetical protein
MRMYSCSSFTEMRAWARFRISRSIGAIGSEGGSHIRNECGKEDGVAQTVIIDVYDSMHIEAESETKKGYWNAG